MQAFFAARQPYLHPMQKAYLNHIATAVPDHDIHQKFIDYAPSLLDEGRSRDVFRRMAARTQIEHRYSFLKPSADAGSLDEDNFYAPQAFPGTKARMKRYEQHAFTLARQAFDQLDLHRRRNDITHLIITSCTGFYAPGLDLQIIHHYGLKKDVERSMIGFMGCYAAMNALKLARHIVRSEKAAQVAILNLELCTLHLQDSGKLENMLSFLIFADGCAASLVSADNAGVELQSFHSTVLPDSRDQITWDIGQSGFDMTLSGRLPSTILAEIPRSLLSMTGGATPSDFQHWAIHPGGRSILDAVRDGTGLGEDSLKPSRDILRRYGNMSSATIMFVLKNIMERANPQGRGCAMAFGPGVTVESMVFGLAG